MTVPPQALSSAAELVARRGGWNAGRVVSLVAGSVLAVIGLGLVAAGGVGVWATTTQRDGAGYLTTPARTFDTASSAITSDRVELGRSTGWITPGGLLGTVRVRAASTDAATSIFVGIAPEAAATRYLSGVDRLFVTDWADGRIRQQFGHGTGLAAPPAAAGIWTAQTSGYGRQSLSWRPTGGKWVVVVMNTNGSAGVAVTADVGATVPNLAWISVGLFTGGGLLLLTLSGLVIAVSTARAGRIRSTSIGEEAGAR